MATREKTGGRAKGTRNKLNDAHRLAIHRACREIGSGRALVGGSRSDPLTRFYVRAWQAEPATFLSKVLPAVLPPPREDDLPDMPLPAESSIFDAARRIAFVLSRAEAMSPRPLDVEMVELSRPLETVEVSPAPQIPEPQDPPPAPLPPLDEAPTIPRSYPKGDPEGVEETHTESLKTFRGTVPSEQGRSHARSGVIDKRRQAHDDYLARLTPHRRSLI